MATAVHIRASLCIVFPTSGECAHDQRRGTTTQLSTLSETVVSCSYPSVSHSLSNVSSSSWVLRKQAFQSSKGDGEPLLARQRRRMHSSEKRMIICGSGADNLGLGPVVEQQVSDEAFQEPPPTSKSVENIDNITPNFSNASDGDASISLQSELTSEDESSAASDANGSPTIDETQFPGVTFDERVAETTNSFDEDAENWRMFAAEEGAGSVTEEFDRDSSVDPVHEGEQGPEQGVKRRRAEDVLPLPGGAESKWTPKEKEKIKVLQKYEYRHEDENGVFVVQAMRTEHMKATEELLVDSFAELMGGLLTYRPLLALTVKQYVRDRCAALPQAVTLVGLYAPAEDNPDMKSAWSGNWLVAGTVELSFSVSGHPYLPSPAPPPTAPYICNMAVSKDYRRRGLGRQMLKAVEDLALTMGCQDMYLHCRIVDTAPLNMYKLAGYQVVATDSLFSVLTFQRRRYLMRKRLSQAKLVPEYAHSIHPV